NKTGKYLKYAIGEIILVVIGILIALQINTWNEDRKERQVELKILHEIANNLSTDTVFFKKAISDLAFFERVNTTILEHLENKTPLVDSLKWRYANLHGDGGTRFTTIGLENLKSEGARIIKNDSLRSSIVGLYKQLEFMINWKNVYAVNTELFQRMHTARIKIIDFDATKSYQIGEPIDLVALQNDHEFKEAMKFNIMRLHSTGRRYKTGYDALKEVLASIRSEINVREKP
ncbi:MAG: hypothetical protein EX263_13960, partial [Flavobacteriaceae bacterium]